MMAIKMLINLMLVTFWSTLHIVVLASNAKTCTHCAMCFTTPLLCKELWKKVYTKCLTKE